MSPQFRQQTPVFLLIPCCTMQLNTDIAPVAALVNVVDGMVTTIVGGCIFALADRANITSLRDLVNMKVLFWSC